MKVIYSEDPNINLFKDLIDAILIHKSQKVTVFLCGGSTVNFYTYFVSNFASFLEYAKAAGVIDFSFLTFALTDDRWFGDNSDDNINSNQIEKINFYKNFENLGAKVIKITESESMENDAKNYDRKVQDLMVSYKILIAGVGENGHTCGIFPAYDQKTFEETYADNFAVSVKVEDKFSNRITITPKVVKQMNECMIYMVGENKKDVLQKLVYEDIALFQMPAQIYKKLENVKIYTNVI